jgi:hypothetical protein
LIAFQKEPNMLERKRADTGKTHKPTYAEVFKIADIVRQHCKAEGGYAIYEPGWSDGTVAKELGGRFTQANVANVRIQLIGPIPKRNRQHTHTKESLAKRLAEVEARLNELEDRSP